MNTDLNNFNEIKKYDTQDVLGSTRFFIDQCKQVKELIENFEFPTLNNIQNIVVAGMGGSAYGGIVVLHLFKNQLKSPITVNSDYTLPEFVNEKTLVICTSYSGNTEEVLSCLDDAQKRGAQIISLSGGGKLAELSPKAVVFDTKFNPSGQPRLGTGYIVFGTIMILSKLGLINLSENEVSQAISYIEQVDKKIEETGKSLASSFFDFIPVIFAAEFLLGNAHILRNQFNETSKSFSACSPLPELNHHLMEGLKNPEDKKLKVLILNSEKYSPVLQKRVILTEDVVGQNKIEVVKFTPQGPNNLAQVLETLMFGGYITFYLGILYGQDPSLIPWVDYFKEKLAAGK